MPSRIFYSLDPQYQKTHVQKASLLSNPVSVLALRTSLKDRLIGFDSSHPVSKSELLFDLKHIFTKIQHEFDVLINQFKPKSKSEPETQILKPVTKAKTFENSKILNTTTKAQNITSRPPIDSSIYSPQLFQSMVLETAGRIEQRYRKLILGLLSLFVFLIVINLYTVFYLNFSSRTTPVVNAETQSLAPNIQQIKSGESGLRIVRDFAGNSALADIGFQLEQQKNLIKTKGSPNCKTPILPPMENGCHFLLIPSALGVPSRGVVYRSIGVDATLGDGDKIQIDIKNYEKDQIEPVAVIDSTNITKDFTLPENIPASSGILFRLWAKNQDITIKQLNLRYFSVDDLKQVAGTLSGDLAKIQETPKIYLDANQNKKFDKDIDKIWSCRPNFPGAKVNLDSEGKFVVEPDDGCFVDIKPDCWYKTKVNKCSLPNGKWLFVWETKPIVIPFEVTDNTDSLNLKASL